MTTERAHRIGDDPRPAGAGRRGDRRAGSRRLGTAAAAVLAAACLAVPAGAQDGRDGASTGRAATQETPVDSLLVYEREVFAYPTGDRRDPFLPLNAGERLGPRFQDLSLTGILHNPEVSSVATLTDRKTQKRYRVRVGDVLGTDIRVTEIRPGEVVFTITSYGVSRREVLRVKKEEGEG